MDRQTVVTPFAHIAHAQRVNHAKNLVQSRGERCVSLYDKSKVYYE